MKVRTRFRGLVQVGTHGVDIPYPNGVIVGCRGKVHAVRRPRDVGQALCMPAQITDELPGEGGPNLGDVIGGFFFYRANRALVDQTLLGGVSPYTQRVGEREKRERRDKYRRMPVTFRPG
jgi:hypothetical protein